jgi:hypothetical protein
VTRRRRARRRRAFTRGRLQDRRLTFAADDQVAGFRHASLSDMTEWEAIEPIFTRLRDFVSIDLERYTRQEHGGNFAVVALVLAACDALGNLRYGGGGSGARILERCLPEEWKRAAGVLYDALRNGLIHGYDAKIVVDDQGSRVAFVIGWPAVDKHMHMQFLTKERDNLYIHAPSLFASLKATFADVERELRESGDLRDRMFKRDPKGREMRVSGKQATIWREAVSRAGVANQELPLADRCDRGSKLGLKAPGTLVSFSVSF